MAWFVSDMMFWHWNRGVRQAPSYHNHNYYRHFCLHAGHVALALVLESDKNGDLLSWAMGLWLFNDKCFQYGRSLSCMTTLFLNLQITRSDIRPRVKWAVSLVIAYGHFNLKLREYFLHLLSDLPEQWSSAASFHYWLLKLPQLPGLIEQHWPLGKLGNSGRQ